MSASATSAAPQSALERACGTDLNALAEQLHERAAMPLNTPLPTPLSVDSAGIAILEDDGGFFYTNSGGQTLVDIADVTRAFYRTHGDDYDFLALYLASPIREWLGSPGALAASWAVRNDTQGIGLPLFDLGSALGSASRLQNVLTMNGLQRYPTDPDAPIGGPGDTFNTFDVLAHELAHRWLAYVYVDSAGQPTPSLLGRDLQHWGFFFDADTSVMEGCDWAIVGPDSFVTDAVTSTYGVLDQYLMGMRTHAEIDSFFVVNDPSDFNPPGTYIPISDPQVGVGCHGQATWWKVSDIEAVHGPRVPDGSVAPRHFRIAYALLEPRDSTASAGDLAKMQVILSRFPQKFADMTTQRGSLDETLDSQPGHVEIRHVALGGSEDTADPRTVGARISIAGNSAPGAVDPASVMLHWRAGTSGAFTDVPMAAVVADSFAASVPPQGAGTTVQYWLSAASTGLAAAAQAPAAGPAAPYTFVIGPDVTPPTVRCASMAFQSRDRLPQTLLAIADDDIGVDSVWVEYRIDASATPHSATATHVGSDSFTVVLPAGLAIGQRIAYRVVARDVSAAHHLGYSNVAFDTLRVIHDWVDDFEHPSGYMHQNSLFSWRDQWHPDTSESSPAGGTAWHCGSDDGTPYEPHEDAVLYSPLIYDVVPGTILTFDQRYDLEEEDPGHAFDAARIEVQVGNGAFAPATPVPGYNHTMDESAMPFAVGAPCWSGASPGWVTTKLDLGAIGSGTLRVRWRMCADDFIGHGGWWVDRVRVQYPDDPTLGVPAPTLALAAGPAWPNPSRGALRMALTLPRTSSVDWALHDVQGRRVATLYRGARAAGRGELAASAPTGLAPGLYFSRLAVDGRVLRAERVAIFR